MNSHLEAAFQRYSTKKLQQKTHKKTHMSKSLFNKFAGQLPTNFWERDSNIELFEFFRTVFLYNTFEQLLLPIHK